MAQEKIKKKVSAKDIKKEEKAPVVETEIKIPVEVEEEIKVDKQGISFDVNEIKEAEVETTVVPKELKTFNVDTWSPKTEMGRQVKSGMIKEIDVILDSGQKILESEIIDTIFPGIDSELLMIGQSKGKFGGGARRVFKQTQKKTKEGNKPNFATISVIGNKNGYVGLGYGKSKETVPAREKAIRNAKLNIFKIKRGCGSWQCGCGKPHSIPFEVTGKVGSCIVRLIPAPKGNGLCVEKELKKILTLAGIKDIWAKSHGQTGTKVNMIYACEKALKQLSEMKVTDDFSKQKGIISGNIKKDVSIEE